MSIFYPHHVNLIPGEGNLNVPDLLGAVHYEHPRDGPVNWSVQGDAKRPVNDSDRPILIAESLSFYVISVKTH